MSAQLSPDCRDGKHDACTGSAWDIELDDLADCPCECKCNGEVWIEPNHQEQL